MSYAWRLASSRYDPLTGEGARLVGGRWNSPRFAMVYASESLALCLAESLVHVPGVLPADYISFKLELPDETIEIVNRTTLKADWTADIGYTRAIGDQWIQQARTVALAVPSAVLIDSTNILINPNHRDARLVRVTDRQSFTFDPRLRP